MLPLESQGACSADTHSRDETSGGRFSSWLRRHWRFLIVLAALTVFGAASRFSPALYRPLEHDEFLSVDSFTSVGYTTHIEELQHRKRFDLGSTIKGLTRSFTGWDFNTHQAHTAAVSIGTFFLGFSEGAIRTPAALASVLMTLLVAALVYYYTRSEVLALLLGLLSVVHPYFVTYGQIAHGYTTTGLLVAAQIALIEWGRRWWHTPAVAFTMAGLSYLIFLNLISTVFLWLFPLYVCALVGAQPGMVRKPSALIRDPAWRSWLVQGIAVAILIVQFILIRLFTIQNSQAKFGLKIRALGDLPAEFWHVVVYLFPGWWLGLGVLTIIGVFLMLRRQDWHWLAPVLLLAPLVLAGYAAATHKISYERTYGLLLVPSFIAVAWLWRALASLEPRRSRFARGGMLAGLSTLFLLSVAGAFPSPQAGASYGTLAQTLRQRLDHEHRAPADTLLFLPHVWMRESLLQLPSDKAFYKLGPSRNTPFDVFLLCEKSTSGDALNAFTFDPLIRESVMWPIPSAWAGRRVVSQGPRSIYQIPMRTSDELPASPPAGKAALVVWTGEDPWFNAPKMVATNLKTQKPPWNVPVLIQDFIPGQQFTFLIGSDEDFRSVTAIIAELRSRTRGKVHFLEPVL